MTSQEYKLSVVAIHVPGCEVSVLTKRMRRKIDTCTAVETPPGQGARREDTAGVCTNTPRMAERAQRRSSGWIARRVVIA